MEEMTTAGEQHRQPKLIACLDRISIPHAAPRMNHGRDAMTGRKTHRVIEWEAVSYTHLTLPTKA